MKKPTERGALGVIEIALIVLLLAVTSFVTWRVAATDTTTPIGGPSADTANTSSASGNKPVGVPESTEKPDDKISRSDDVERKTDINSLHAKLELYELNNGFYPRAEGLETMPEVDREWLIDENGKKINTADSAYTYKPSGCNSMGCTEYVLSTTTSSGPYEKHSLSE